MILMIEKMQSVVHATERGDAPCGGGQMHGRFRRGGAGLQRQQAGDHLQAVEEAVVELLRQQVVVLRQFGLLAQQDLFAHKGRL